MKNVLRLGSNGDAVKLLQGLLGVSPADGVFGPQTESAVKSFQQKQGLLVDGVVGGNTWAALLDGKDIDTNAALPTNAKVEDIFVGARIVDSYPFSLGGTKEQAKALRNCARPVDGMFVYLGVCNRERANFLLDAGHGVAGVTLANRFDGAAAVQQAVALGLPVGTSLSLDIEGKMILGGIDWTQLGPPEKAKHVQDISDKVKAWRDTVKGAGYKTMLYVGSPQPFTSKELSDFGFDAYWNALSREADRFGMLAEPSRGYQMWQMFPQHYWQDTGVFVDVNIVGQDFFGKLPSWAVRA